MRKNTKTLKVAPRAGAWIETHARRPERLHPHVAPRAVVELTKDYCSQQRQLFEYIKEYLKEKENITITSYKLKREFKDGIPVTMKGLGFYDGWHTPDDHGRKQTYGSSWELHPVVNVEFE